MKPHPSTQYIATGVKNIQNKHLNLDFPTGWIDPLKTKWRQISKLGLSLLLCCLMQACTGSGMDGTTLGAKEGQDLPPSTTAKATVQEVTYEPQHDECTDGYSTRLRGGMQQPVGGRKRREMEPTVDDKHGSGDSFEANHPPTPVENLGRSNLEAKHAPKPAEDVQGSRVSELIESIRNYRYYPKPRIHALMSAYIYEYPSEGGLPEYEIEEEHNLKWSSERYIPGWSVEQAEYKRETGFGSALYVNPKAKQAVLTFQGTCSRADIQEDIVGILSGGTTNQQSRTYLATERAIACAKEKKAHLSITGHSLGGFLAEIAIYFCHNNLSYPEVQGVVFDSPGALDWLRLRKANIPKGEAFDVFMNWLPVTSYLSVPNLLNSCNGHLGTVYRLYPTLRSDDSQRRFYSRWAKSAMRFLFPETNKAYEAIKAHSFTVILPCFDSKTNDPIDYKRVGDWPKIHKENLEERQRKSGKRPSGRIWGTLGSAMSVIYNSSEVDRKQYWTTIEHMNEDFRQRPEMTADQKFTLLFDGHYEESALGTHEDTLKRATQQGTVDYYLKELGLHGEEAAFRHIEDSAVRGVLQSIRQQYTVNKEDARTRSMATISLNDKKAAVDTVRTQMRRAREVLGNQRMDKALQALKNREVWNEVKRMKEDIAQLSQKVDSNSAQIAVVLTASLKKAGGELQKAIISDIKNDLDSGQEQLQTMKRHVGEVGKLLGGYESTKKQLCQASNERLRTELSEKLVKLKKEFQQEIEEVRSNYMLTKGYLETACKSVSEVEDDSIAQGLKQKIDLQLRSLNKIIKCCEAPSNLLLK